MPLLLWHAELLSSQQVQKKGPLTYPEPSADYAKGIPRPAAKDVFILTFLIRAFPKRHPFHPTTA